MKKHVWLTGAILATLSLSALSLMPWHAAASPPRVEARLSSDALEVGEPAQLSVTVTGDAASAPVLPATPGLDVLPYGSSQQMTIVNGVVDRSVTHHYQVRPRRAGHFTIGPVRVGNAASRPIALDVTPAGRGAPTANGAGSARAPTSQTVIDGPPGRRAFLSVRVPKDRVVVGESVPVTIRAFVKAGTAGTIQGLPQLSTDAFLVEGLEEEPKTGRTEIGGTPYATMTWSGRLTALLPGAHEVSVSVPASLEWQEIVRDETPRRDRFSSLFDRFFDDPFFSGSPFAGSPFGSFGSMGVGRTRSARLTLEDDLGTLTVVEPPLDGRPEGYDGAVGHFTLEARASAPSTRVGEPITLRLTVRGEGNFDRVEHAMLSDDFEGARVYPVTSRFDEEAGEKIFEQAITPTTAGALTLPALELSYFDPDTGAYATARTEPLSVEVAPSPEGSISNALSDAPPDAAHPSMAPDAGSPGTFVPSLVPETPWMPWLFGIVMGLAVAGGIALRRRDPEAAALRRGRRRHRRASREARRAMRDAARTGDPSRFHRSAVRAVQADLGARWGVAPEAVTLVELEAHGEVPPDLREIFERADAIAFGGRVFDNTSIDPARVERALLEYDR